MRKLTAIMLTMALVLSCICVISVSAVPLLSLTADMEGGFNSATGTYITNVAGARTGFEGSHNSNSDTTASEFMIAGSAADKKSYDDQMLMGQLYANGGSNSNWNGGTYRPRQDINFLSGQQIYMRAQYYLPSKSIDGDSYADYNDNFVVSMIGNYLDSDGNSVSLALLSLQSVDANGGNFYFAGDKNSGFKANEVWEYDTWYTIEAIIIAGESAVVSVYVNGELLSFENQDFSSSVSYNTGKGCVKISESHYQKSKQWLYYMTSSMMGENALKRQLYTDNWAFALYPANESITLWTPPVYNPVTFVGVVDGDEMRTNELKNINIDTGDEECDVVELYVDDELVGSDSQAPYSFEITKRYDPGEHVLRAVAQVDSDIYEVSINITLTEFNPLSFDGISDGDEVYDKKFETIIIDTENEPCESVSLYVDEILIETKTSKPYVFNLADILDVGTHTLCAKAIVGTTEYECEIDIVVISYNPLSFDGISDGAKITFEDFNSITVLTGDETADEISLYVDGEVVDTLNSDPFTFHTSENYSPGVHCVSAVAYVGGDIYELSVNVTLLGNYDKLVMNQSFDNYASFYDAQNGGWYQPSSRMYNAKAPNGWFIQSGNIKDKNSASYGQSFSLGCDPASSATYKDSNNLEYSYLTFGYNAMSSSPVSGNKVKVEWYTLFSNDKTTEFVMGIGSSNGASTDNQICQWDATEKKIKWNVEGTPYTTVEINKWQKYTLIIDMSSSPKMSLAIDDVSIFDELTPNAPFNSFTKIIWKYVPDCNAGSYVALDEIKITHIIPRPFLSTAKFWIDDASSDDWSNVSPLTNAISIDVEGGLISANLAENVELLENGKAVKVVDSAGNELKPTVLLSNNKLWIVPHIPLMANCDYSVKLASGARFEDNVEIGYDQYFNFTTDKGRFEIVNVSFPVNGDTVGANVRIFNNSGEAKSIKLLLALYSDGKLMSISVKSVTVSSKSSVQTISANEVSVRAEDNFSAVLMVLDEINYPIDQYEMGN